jgi:SAM-dependent methyltransferase
MENLKPWYEDELFWEHFEPLLFNQKRVESTVSEIDSVLSLTQIKPPQAVLDICCGIGRHSVELAKRGFSVTGVDRTALYLAKARLQAHTEGIAIEFVQEDMRKFRRTEQFDCAINLFTSFGYFDDPADDVAVLANIYQSLRKGGVLVMEMLGKEILAKSFRERDWQEVDDLIVLEERKVANGWSAVESRWILLDGNARYEAKLFVRHYSGTELKALLQSVGFELVTIYGSLAGIPYDHQAARLVVVARK